MLGFKAKAAMPDVVATVVTGYGTIKEVTRIKLQARFSGKQPEFSSTGRIE
jgi:hypothetical protein